MKKNFIYLIFFLIGIFVLSGCLTNTEKVPKDKAETSKVADEIEYWLIISNFDSKEIEIEILENNILLESITVPSVIRKAGNLPGYRSKKIKLPNRMIELLVVERSDGISEKIVINPEGDNSIVINYKTPGLMKGKKISITQMARPKFGPD